MLTTRTPHLPRIFQYFGKPLLLLVSWDLLVVAAVKHLGWTWMSVEGIPLAMYGSVLGIVVGFRNNCAYSRWWEARILWGRLVECSRNLARQASGLSLDGPDGAILARRVIHHQIAYVHALRQTLRGQPLDLDMASLDIPGEPSRLTPESNIPSALQRRIAILLGQARRQHCLHAFDWHVMERTLGDIASAQGGVERIKNTPLPRQYDFFVMLFVQTYCMVLPLGMVATLGWLTPLGSTVVSFMFLALDRIGRSLEDPFENSVYDVPLTALTTRIEIELRQILQESDLPKPAASADGVLV